MSGAALEPGAVFGKDFRVVRALRAGGMGAVYVVEQLSTGKPRALKVMAPELASDPAIRERFVLEAKAASRIESDHVVEIVTAGVDEETGAPFLVMELLKGEELADACGRVGALALGDVLEILEQIGHALEQAHAQGIVHRDLKPENVFLATSRRRDAAFTAKVLDFGIAKLVEGSQKTGTQPLGTPLYMAPEQTDRKGRITPATDVWALGLIAFKLITGVEFWLEASGSLPMLLREIVVDPLPLASARAAELGVAAALPPGFDAWFARCVCRDLDARFHDAGEAVRAFAELVPRDAPRGALVVTDAGRSGAAGTTGAQASSGAPAADATSAIDPNAATIGVAVADEGATSASSAESSGIAGASTTGALSRPSPSHDAPPPPKPSSKLPLALGAMAVAAVLAGGAIALRSSGRGERGAERRHVPTAHASPVVTAGHASAAPSAAGPRCPSGMVLIPGGQTVLGARDLAEAAQAKPTHDVMITAFCLDRTEVTTKAYDACVAKGACERALDHVSWPGITPADEKRYSPLCNENKPSRADHPINCVAWSMAAKYCEKRGARLPTEAEWEYAARGPRQRIYPWGDEPPSGTRLNACGKECAEAAPRRESMYDDDDGWVGTAPVGSFPAGASTHGVLDLAGNVWEWTADWFAPYPADAATDPKGPATGTMKVARGGDFLSTNREWIRPAWRFRTDPDTYNHAIGFRCAADAK